MTQCPACAQPISPNQERCPKCGIPLHHGVDSGSRQAGGGGGAGSSGLVIAVLAVLGVLTLLLICGGGFFFVSARSVVAPGPVVTPPTVIEIEPAPQMQLQPAEREDQPTP